MEKLWLRSYPPGVPAEVDVNEFSSLGDLFERSVKRWPERTAYINMGRHLRYRQLDEYSAQFASWLQSSLQLPRGARVALMMPNILQYPIAMFGALRAGYTVVNCNPLYTPRELSHQLRDSGAEVIVVLENFAHTLQEVIAQTQVKHVVVTSIGASCSAPRAA
jgi:long-chain acyl-CoA synthetase